MGGVKLLLFQAKAGRSWLRPIPRLSEVSRGCPLGSDNQQEPFIL